MVLDATPDTSAGLKKQAWKEPTVQAEFKVWAKTFGVPQPELEEQLWTFAVGWNTAREGIVGPLHRYLGWAHARQSWQMFVAPHTTPSRLQIQELVTGEWQTLFEERHAEHTWMAGAFGTERMRASVFRWSWPSYETSWRRACESLAARRFAEEDRATAFRCRFYQAATPSPEQAERDEAPKGKWVRTVSVTR